MTLQEYFDLGAKKIDFAERLGVTCGQVSHWTGGKQVSAERCIQIEEATDGLVSCEDLRPDIKWHILRRKVSKCPAS